VQHVTEPIKQITGLKQKSIESLVGLAQWIHNGDMHALADHINKFFQKVAAELRPLSVSTTPPTPDVLPIEFIIKQSAMERKLSQINVYKAPDQRNHLLMTSLSIPMLTYRGKP